MTGSSLNFLPVALVAGAAALDVFANLLLARSDGFRIRLYGFTSLAAVGLAFYVLSVAVRSMDLAVAYAMWGGFGILGTSVGGWLLMGQRVNRCGWAGMGLLLCGMVALHLG